MFQPSAKRHADRISILIRESLSALGEDVAIKADMVHADGRMPAFAAVHLGGDVSDAAKAAIREIVKEYEQPCCIEIRENGQNDRFLFPEQPILYPSAING